MRLANSLAPRAVVALAALFAAGCAAIAQDESRRSLVEAEQAFARMSVLRGLHEAFLANFADDGIAFEPAPVRLRETWGARPAPADPKALALHWHPVIAGVARSGELGFTSGPFVLADASGIRAPTHGIYFSVWRRDAAGLWKVAIDAGIRTPVPVADGTLLPDPVVASAPAGPRAPSLDEADSAASGDSAAFASTLARDARWHVDGRAPVIGRDAIVAARASEAQRLRFVTQGREIAASGDLGYTYGGYGAAGSTAGYYVHLWNRDGERGWRLLVAVHLPS
jgi:ketosteroid isomerase-like protein